jgi:pSer/pThr/pTyr-binding forkhead associated (FHA) protein
LQGGGRWQATTAMLAPATDNGYLQSNSAFSDFTLKFDYRSTADADCSVLLRAAQDGDPKETGYQLQIGDAKSSWPTGSIVDHFKADAIHPASGQWHTVETTLSGDHISVKLDGRQVADGKNSRARGGYVAFSCSKAGKAQFRNVMLRPAGMNALFNGSDLSNWKAVGPAPPKKAGMFKKMMGGGGKQKDAEWSVAGGAIHAQSGTGQLETTAMYDDFVLQVAVRINSKDKNNHPKSAIFFRGDAGQLFTGYAVDVMNAAKNGQPAPGGTGGLQGLASPKRAEGNDNQFVTETIAARGRHIQVWVDGYPVSDFQDTRAEGASPQKDARTTAGTISLQSPDEKANLDFRRIQVAQLPKTLGKGAAQATAIPAPTPVPAVAAPGQAAFQLPPPDPNKPRIAQLMSQAIATNDPQQQLELYAEVIRLDPSNQAAFTGHQQAQQKIDETRAKQQQEEQQTEQANQSESDKQTKGEEARQEAETAFVNRDFKTAQEKIALADSLLSASPAVQQLRSRIDAAVAARDRIRYFATGAGAIALIGIIVLYFRSRGQKEPYLEVVEGLDKGKRYNLDQDIVHIGAVPQDGGNKNEIVVRDIERMISRFHCEVHKHNGKFFLIDCNSANGTTLDRKRVSGGKPVQLKSGARLELAGTCTLRLGFEKKKS